MLQSHPVENLVQLRDKLPCRELQVRVQKHKSCSIESSAT